jgi:hypothetical protein
LHKHPNLKGQEEKRCTNINDCPLPPICGGRNDQNISRGTCQDHLIAYSCTCGSGYEVTMLPDFPSNATCTPVKCGMTQEVEHASNERKALEADYDTKPWHYKCDEGYTLSGVALTLANFSVRCTADAAFSAMQTCKPVSCGALESMEYQDASPFTDDLLFPNKVTYTCEEGYSLDHQANGPKDYKVSCEADGKKTSMKECHPVECGKVPQHADADYDKETIFHFTQSAKITCHEGYSLDRRPMRKCSLTTWTA